MTIGARARRDPPPSKSPSPLLHHLHHTSHLQPQPCSKNRTSTRAVSPAPANPQSRITTPQKTKLKSSIQRNLRSRLLEQFPLLAPHIDVALPKKTQLEMIKLPDRLSLYALDGNVLFFQHFDDPLVPHLKLVHAYPHCFPRVMVDRGAIRFVLSGAQLMCPGLTSPGAKLPPKEEELLAGQVVAVYAEGKETACMVGVLKMGTEEVKKVNKGVAVEAGHYLGDGLWKFVVE